MAERISAAARELGVAADPSAVRTVQLTIDTVAGSEVMAFWPATVSPPWRPRISG